MDKEVLIHVKGLHMIDSQGEEEPVEIIVPGEYYFRNGSHYLRYEEIVEDSRKPTINYIKREWSMYIWFLSRERRI